MKYRIQIAPLIGPLPIPHYLGWPDYIAPSTYYAIIPEDMMIVPSDEVDGFGSSKIVKKIVERHPAKGDWLKQEKHKNPHYIRFVAI